jgi:hypothetical protein
MTTSRQAPLDPPPAALGGPGPLVLFVAAAPIQIGRGLDFLWRQLTLPIQEGRLRRASRKLGREMHRAGVGDQILRERLAQLEATPGRRDARVVSSAEENLGRAALVVDAPVLGAEEPFRNARRARDAVGRTRDRLRQTAARLWPDSALGWLQLGVSYVGLLLLVTLAFALAAKVMVDGQGNTPIISRPPQTTTARIGDVNIKVTEATVTYELGRAQDQPGDRVQLNSPVLEVYLQLTNIGGIPVSYNTYRGRGKTNVRDFAHFVDSNGDELLRVVGGGSKPPGGIDQATIEPGQTIKDILIFVPPPERVSHLDLFFPGGNLGSEAKATIRLPWPFFDPARNAVPESH